MNAVQNENLRMRNLLRESKLECVDSHSKRELIDKADSLVLADYSLLDFYDLEEAVQKDVDFEFVDKDFSDSMRCVNVLTTPANNDFLKEITEDWIPVLKQEGNNFRFVDLAFNVETNNFDTISNLNYDLNLVPIRVQYCSYAGEQGFSSEYGSYYEKDPEYSETTVSNSFNLRKYIEDELHRENVHSVSWRDVRPKEDAEEFER